MRRNLLFFLFRFWYISITSCYQNKQTCKWHHYDHFKNITENFPLIDFNFEVVNGNPKSQAHNFFIFHFSFDQQNILEMYLIFFIIYLILVPLQLYAVRIQKHPVTKLFTLSLMLEFISLCFILVHMIKFALNGSGNDNLKIIGDIFDIFSRVSVIKRYNSIVFSI